MTAMADSPITILHLAVDYNTPQRPRTTTAIEWMVQELGEFDNVVVAYRRSPRPGGLETPCPAEGLRLYDFPFFGLPGGIGLHMAMRRAARRTIRRLEADGVRPSIVHAHKLTFEGIAGWYVSRHFGVPLFVSMRGEVETKVLRWKPQLRGFLRRLCQSAARLYFVSVWFRDEFHAFAPGLEDRERPLPNIVRNVTPTLAAKPPNDAFVAVLDLNTWKRKGVAWLLEGFAKAAAQEPAMRLDIIGGGRDESVARVKAMIAAHGLGDRVSLLGRIDNNELLDRLAEYRGMVLPSVNETFGMAYVEALFAGIPVLFTRGTGIDGYLDGLDVARTVRPRDADDVTAALLELWRDADGFRARITAAAPQLFATFDPVAAMDRYRTDVRAAVARDRAQE